MLYLLTAPAAVFLMVGYSECLFLALAIPAWLAATRSQWWRAALLAALSGLVRPDALFLIAALAAMALRGPAPLRGAAKISCAMAGPAAYELYLTARTGNWAAWRTAKQAGWNLHLVTPLQAFRTTWAIAFQHPYSAASAFGAQLELVAMAAMIAAALAFLWWYRWPEAVYCGLAVVVLGTQTWYQSCPRTLLVLFPIWVALAQAEKSRRWVPYLYFGASAPLAAIVGLLFLTYQLTG